MSTLQTAFRLSDELVARIDQYAAHLSTKHGLDVSRAAAVRVLLERSLEKLALPALPPKPKAKGSKPTKKGKKR